MIERRLSLNTVSMSQPQAQKMNTQVAKANFNWDYKYYLVKHGQKASLRVFM